MIYHFPVYIFCLIKPTMMGKYRAQMIYYCASQALAASKQLSLTALASTLFKPFGFYVDSQLQDDRAQDKPEGITDIQSI